MYIKVEKCAFYSLDTYSSSTLEFLVLVSIGYFCNIVIGQMFVAFSQMYAVSMACLAARTQPFIWKDGACIGRTSSILRASSNGEVNLVELVHFVEKTSSGKVNLVHVDIVCLSL